MEHRRNRFESDLMLPHAMLSIETLLSRQRVALVDQGGISSDIDEMQHVWRRVWRDFGSFTEIRNHLISGYEAALPFFPTTAASAELLEYLTGVGLLKAYGRTYRFSCPRTERLLRGSWLEELGATVAWFAGAEEVRFSQKLNWRSQYDPQLHFNEVDVMARFGERIAFVSCKALAPLSTTNGSGAHRIAKAIREVARWRKRFGAGMGYAILLTTADFIDETRHQLRNKELTERAAQLDVDLVSADSGDFEGLVRAFENAVHFRPTADASIGEGLCQFG